MKRIFCDVCGREINLQERMAEGEIFPMKSVAGGEKIDICSACAVVGKSMDPKAIVMEAWKKTVVSRSGNELPKTRTA